MHVPLSLITTQLYWQRKNEAHYISSTQDIDPSLPSTITLPGAKGETKRRWSMD
jgi:hypothetical protein